jgi:hypothetical protein
MAGHLTVADATVEFGDPILLDAADTHGQRALHQFSVGEKNLDRLRLTWLGVSSAVERRAWLFSPRYREQS